MFVFHKLLKETREVDASSSIIILQKYLDNKNSTERVNGKTVDRYMTSNEFLPNEPYGCKIIMTNTSRAREDRDALLPDPTGRLPADRLPARPLEDAAAQALLHHALLLQLLLHGRGPSSRTTPRTSSTPWHSRWLACAALPFPS